MQLCLTNYQKVLIMKNINEIKDLILKARDNSDNTLENEMADMLEHLLLHSLITTGCGHIAEDGMELYFGGQAPNGEYVAYKAIADIKRRIFYKDRTRGFIGGKASGLFTNSEMAKEEYKELIKQLENYMEKINE